MSWCWRTQILKWCPKSHKRDQKKNSGPKNDGSIVSISWPNSISKAVFQEIGRKLTKRQADLKTAEWPFNASVGVYVCKERIPWMGRWESAIMSHAGRKDREWGQNKKKKVEGGQEDRESDGDRLRARERAPKEQLQKLKRRCGTKPPGMVSNSTKLCQTWTHKNAYTHTHKHFQYKKKSSDEQRKDGQKRRWAKSKMERRPA